MILFRLNFSVTAMPFHSYCKSCQNLNKEIREATKRKSKKNFTTSVNYLQKWRTPPPPISQQFQPLLELENQFFFAIIKSLWMRGIDKNKIGDLFEVKI